jgi:selenocysteine-specific elongation factor
MTRSGWDTVESQALAAVAAYHTTYPLRPGLPREELRTRLRLPTQAYGPALDRLADGPLIEAGAALRLPSHTAALTPDQEATVATYLARLEASPFSPPTDQSLEPEILTHLFHSARAVRVGEDIIFPITTYNEAVDRIRTAIEEQGTITVGQVRDLFGTSRKRPRPPRAPRRDQDDAKGRDSGG